MRPDRTRPNPTVPTTLPSVDDHRWIDETGQVQDEPDRGLRYDLGQLRRRSVLVGLGGVGLLGLAGCTSGSGAAGPSGTAGAAATGTSTTGTTGTTTGATASSTSGTATSAGASGQAVGEVPSETAGPYPGNGSNGPNVLDDNGIVRQDITSSFGTSTTRAAGIPLTLRITVTDKATGAARPGVAVYAWHCDRAGGYSMYSSGLTSENYLRGVQPADATGTVTFTSVFPGCYSGRWPHVHFEVYSSLADATTAGRVVKTSQLALPQDVCQTVYATDGYATSVRNLAQTSLATDNVFRDDQAVKQLATVTGSVAAGYTASLTIGV